MSDKIKRVVSKAATEDQKLYLIERLEMDLPLARNQFSSAEDGRHLQIQKWEILADELNSIGGASKNGSSWKKNRTKSKYTKLKFELNKSGINGDDPIDNLDDIEKRIVSIISIDAVDGDGTTQELGTTLPSPSPQMPFQSSSSSTPKTTIKKRPRIISDTVIDNEKVYFEKLIQLKTEKLNLLRQQIEWEKERRDSTNSFIEEMRYQFQQFELRLNKLENLMTVEYADEEGE